MSRLKELFQRKQKNILNVYCTAGYPQLHDTIPVMKLLQENGADIIELGIPYSDPLADGPVIQASSASALANGMSIPMLLQQLQDFRKEIRVPVVLMGYMNPILQFGFEKFCAAAAAAGVDGLILPDLPEFEFENEYGPVIRKHNLDFVFLITPETTNERVQKLDALSSGFLYAVSSSSITGSGKDFSAVAGYLQRLQQLQLKNPVLVGFGISDRQSFETVCRYANGGIIGSAFIKALAPGATLEQSVSSFFSSVLPN